MENPILEVRDLELSFGGLQSVDRVSFKVNSSEIFGMIGPNGSGKTCVLNMISGVYKADKGSIIFQGRDITNIAVHKRAALGIARAFQNVELFRGMTVLENLLFGCHASMKGNLFSCGFYWWGLAQKEEIAFRKQVEEVIDFLELGLYRKRMAGDLPIGVQKLVGVGRALVMKPKLLLLDEASSGMNREEKEDMARFLLRIKYDLSIPIIWVEHDIQIVTDICDTLVVLNEGRKIAEGSPESVVADAEVIRLYIGTD